MITSLKDTIKLNNEVEMPKNGPWRLSGGKRRNSRNR